MTDPATTTPTQSAPPASIRGENAPLPPPPDESGWLRKTVCRIGHTPLPWLLLGIFAVNLCLRTAITLPAKPYSPPHDGCHYMLLGRQLARGEGYTNRVLYAPRFNQIRPYRDTIPFPDFQRPPALPWLFSLAYRMAGESYLSARMVNVLLASLVPVLAFLLALLLSRNREIAAWTGVLLTLTGPLLNYTSEVMLEPAFLVAMLLFFLCFLGGTRRNRPGLVLLSGLAWGAAWYTRHEALYVLLVPILVELLLYRGWKRGGLLFLGMVAVFAASLFPWHYRAYLTTGSAFYSELRLHLMAAYNPDGFHAFMTTTDAVPPEGPGAFLLQNLDTVLPAYLQKFYTLLMLLPNQVVGAAPLFGLALYALWRGRKNWRNDAFFLLWMLCNIGFFAFTFALERFLFALMPILLYLSARGIIELYHETTRSASLWSRSAGWILGLSLAGAGLGRVARSGSTVEWARETLTFLPNGLAPYVTLPLTLILLGLFLWAGWTGRLTRSLSPRFLTLWLGLTLVTSMALGTIYGLREHLKEKMNPEVVAWLEALPEDEVVMVYRKPFFYGWILDRTVLQIPDFDPTRPEELAYVRNLVSTFKVGTVLLKGRSSQGGSVITYPHPWNPNSIPLKDFRHVTTLTRKKDVYAIYRRAGALVSPE